MRTCGRWVFSRVRDNQAGGIGCGELPCRVGTDSAAGDLPAAPPDTRASAAASFLGLLARSSPLIYLRRSAACLFITNHRDGTFTLDPRKSGSLMAVLGDTLTRA